MENLGANGRTVRPGLETMRPMDRSDCEPGLLRGPGSWALDACAVTTFSPKFCVEILEGENTLSPELIAQARAGIDTLLAARVGGDCWSAPAEAASSATTLVVASSLLGDAFDRMIAAAVSERGQGKLVLLAPADGSKATQETLARLA